MIVVIDYGMGNIKSIIKMVGKVGYDCIASSDPEIIEQAKLLILPGVGYFAKGMSNLREQGLIELLERQVLQKKVPILGICLGMQLLTKHSEEGDAHGLGFVDAQVKKFPSEVNGKKQFVPQMAWNGVVEHNQFDLLSNMPHGDARFYFVHSYYVELAKQTELWLTTNYGFEYCSAFIKDNIVGMQFHPEKSHKYGMQLFKNVLERFL